jgi:outer membrane protein OmpA-like peptidoglycan-associated protein
MLSRAAAPFSLASAMNRLNIFAWTCLAALAFAAQAQAQIQPDVTVNPNATGTKVLLYPGGKYGRVQRPLLQPGEPDPNAPIVLHMPRKHAAAPRVARKAVKPKTDVAAKPPPPQQDYTPPPESAASLIQTAPPPKPKPVPKPAPQKPVTVAKQTPPPPKPKAQPAPEPAQSFLPSTPEPAPPRTASVAPSEPGSGGARSSILFAPGAEEPPASALDTVKGMAASLSAALWSGAASIQLEAYGGAHGDKSSDARRLSLKRALIVRQLLIDDGIPSERIVVRAMGGASSGALDRVDIFVASS